MSLTATFLAEPDGEMRGKPVYVRGILYLEDVPEEGGDSPGGSVGESTGNTEGSGPGGSTESTEPVPDPEPTDPSQDTKPTGYENDGNTETIGYGELKTLMNFRVLN